VFWESHDPTQGMRQGNDIGTQYRSAIFYTSPEQRDAAIASRDAYQKKLAEAGYGEISTQIVPAGEFYFAEDYHQQYLHKVPGGYCPDHGTGVTWPQSGHADDGRDDRTHGIAAHLRARFAKRRDWTALGAKVGRRVASARAGYL
jgi:hypothetical protein